MLVDHLLFAIGHQNDHKAVKACDDPPELEAIHEKQSQGNAVPPHFVQNGIL